MKLVLDGFHLVRLPPLPPPLIQAALLEDYHDDPQTRRPRLLREPVLIAASPKLGQTANKTLGALLFLGVCARVRRHRVAKYLPM